MATVSDKAALRADLSRQRATRNAQALADASTLIADRLIALPQVASASSVALYLSTGPEPPTWQLADRLAVAGVRVLAPVTLPDRVLGWAEYVGPDEVRTAAYGIPEPTTAVLPSEALRDVDVIVVPALAADAMGHRLGRGAGYYDRALATVGESTPRVAVIFDDELLPRVPVEPHDAPVHIVVTPVRTVSCQIDR